MGPRSGHHFCRILIFCVFRRVPGDGLLQAFGSPTSDIWAPTALAKRVPRQFRTDASLCVRNYRRTRPYEFIGLGTMDVTKTYNFMGFGDTHGPKPYELAGSRAPNMSHTPVSHLPSPSPRPPPPTTPAPQGPSDTYCYLSSHFIF